MLLAVSAVIARAPDAAGAGGQKWALLVGIDTYDRPTVPALKFAVADVKSVAWALRSIAGFPADHVFLLTSDRTGESAATRTNVDFRLDWLADRVKPDDTVVFYFSGHGIELRDQTAYLMTQEADPRSPSTLEDSGLDAGRLRQKLARLKARHLLIFVDACRSDPRGGKGGGANVLGKGLSRDLIVTRGPAEDTTADSVAATFFACSPGQRSYEWPRERHGFFTYQLLQGLKGKATDARGRITANSLTAYLSVAVAASTERALNVRQVPWVMSEGSGLDSWPLAVVRPRPPGPAGTAPSRPPRWPAATEPPTVSIAVPGPGSTTERADVALAAAVTGSAVSDVTITVNGRVVPVPAEALKRSAMGALISMAVPLESGENTIVVEAMTQSGRPVQGAVTVVRKGPSAAAASSSASAVPQGVATRRTQAQDTHKMAAAGLPGLWVGVGELSVLADGTFHYAFGSWRYSGTWKLIDATSRTYRLYRLDGRKTDGLGDGSCILSNNRTALVFPREDTGDGTIFTLLRCTTKRTSLGVVGTWWDDSTCSVVTITKNGAYKSDLGDFHSSGTYESVSGSSSLFRFVRTGGDVSYGLDQVVGTLSDDGLLLRFGNRTFHLTDYPVR